MFGNVNNDLFDDRYDSYGIPEPLLSNSTLDDELVKAKEVSILDENRLKPDSGRE